MTGQRNDVGEEYQTNGWQPRFLPMISPGCDRYGWYRQRYRAEPAIRLTDCHQHVYKAGDDQSRDGPRDVFGPVMPVHTFSAVALMAEGMKQAAGAASKQNAPDLFLNTILHAQLYHAVNWKKTIMCVPDGGWETSGWSAAGCQRDGFCMVDINKLMAVLATGAGEIAAQPRQWREKHSCRIAQYCNPSGNADTTKIKKPPG